MSDWLKGIYSGSPVKKLGNERTKKGWEGYEKGWIHQ